MPKGVIQLCYRKIIDHGATKAWDKFVFEDSYSEFLMQAQFYNQEKKHHSFSELIRNLPEAENLHFLVSSSIIGYVLQLNNIVPDILNNLGKHFLPFTNYRFEIINSDIKNKTAHHVAINFFSDPLIWHDTIGNSLLVSPGSENNHQGEYVTDMFIMPTMTSIYSFKPEEK